MDAWQCKRQRRNESPMVSTVGDFVCSKLLERTENTPFQMNVRACTGQRCPEYQGF